jgi:hypothetical protein
MKISPIEVIAPSANNAATAFAGCWRITEMELWDQDAIDTIGPAFISFGGSGGSFRFICVEGDLHCKFSQKRDRPHVEWTWNGQDEMDPANGRGWATLQRDGLLKGRIFIHHGDNAAFTATKSEKDLSGSQSPAPRRRRRW